MAYSLETSSVKTIVPGAEVSGFADVVARQKISALSGEVPQLSAGEGINISTVDGKTVITNNISAGQNISLVYDMETNTYRIDAPGGGKTYTGITPIQVNNTTDEISITGESLSAGPGIDMFSSGGYVVVSSTGKELSAGPGLDLFESGDYFVLSANGVGGSTFPITGTDGTTNYTANCDCSSFYFTTAQGPAGANATMNVKGIRYQAYPSTDVSASWYNIINAANNFNVTCSAVKLTTAASENWFYTSALPNLNEITFIAPSYGPYQTYSALIDDGDTTFVAEVDSGCCMKVVRNWNDDRNKNCWCGLNQETYFYIG
jgi:hypothetical protein